MKSRVHLFVIISLISVFFFAVETHASKKNGLNSFTFGNKQAGATGSYSITAENNINYSSVVLATNGNIKFLNKTVKGVEFTATTENNKGKKKAAYSLSLAGYTVDTGTKTVSYTWNKSINRTLVSASANFTVGPVPVIVSGSVGGSSGIGYTLRLDTNGVGLSGKASAWANGSAAAGVGITLLNLSLTSDLQLLKTSLVPSVNVTPTSWNGGANLVYDPLKVDFSLKLKSMDHTWYSHLLAQYSQPSKTVSLLKL